MRNCWKCRPDIPILLCTGHSSLIDEGKARQLGIAAYMMKPVSMAKIAKTIRKLMDQKKETVKNLKENVAATKEKVFASASEKKKESSK